MRFFPVRIALCALLLAASLCGLAHAELAPRDQHLRKTTVQSMLPEPPGHFRTRLAWLIAARIAYENRQSFDPFFGPATLSQFRSELNGEADRVAALEGRAYYRYAEALVGDLARLEIQMAEDARFYQALLAFGTGVIADVATELLTAGVAKLAKEGAKVDLGNLHLVPGTEANLAYRKALQDLELRYRVMVDRTLFDAMEAKLTAGAISAADVQELVQGSAISAALATTIGAYSGDTRQSFDLMRRQMLLEVASHGCACALKAFDPGAAYRPHVMAFGSAGAFRTPLAFLLSQDLAPPPISPFNPLGLNTGNTAIRELLAQEQAKIARLKAKNPEAYATYLRSLLVDIETLEQLQLEALQSGTAMSFFQGTGLNILFGAVSAAVVPGPQIAATIVSIATNAAYGAKVDYDTTTEAIRIRLRMAALREETLDSLLPHSERCGCDMGVMAAPKRAIRGQ